MNEDVVKPHQKVNGSAPNLPPASTKESEAPSAPVTSDGTEEEAENASSLPFHVVGIGASAGGVEAYIELFDHLPIDTGMAYVVVPHLAADQKSHMTEIIGRHTKMPIIEIKEGMIAEADRVYVVPPKSFLQMQHGVFHLKSKESRLGHRAIDFFFHSLAADQKHRAIGVILSGMDGDGALGLRAIKGEAGIAIVQSPESAQFPDMPRASISTEHVDIVATPSAIATQLGELGKQFRDGYVQILQDGTVPAGEELYFQRILTLLKDVCGVDFRLYKPNTLRRRIARRMLLHRVDTLAAFLTFLKSNPNEIRELHEDALINVTRFFRDTEVFDSLKNLILPKIFANRDPSQQLRIWIAGCSTGEEVYSIVICLLEYLSANRLEPQIQIFGTDASEHNVQKARAGFYPATIAEEVSPERLHRYFTRSEKGYLVAKRLRDLCIFARHNLCQDPPFSRMDLISSRNVLIYFGAELQRQVIPTFHYALRPDGFLLLGTSETIREFNNLFTLLERKHKIYSRTGESVPRVGTEFVPRLLVHKVPAPVLPPVEVWGDTELQRTADRIVIARYAPPGVIINERQEILQSRGNVSPYLEMRPGAATLQLPRLTRENIAPQVGVAVRKAIDEDIPVQVQDLQVIDGDVTREVTLEVLPIRSVSNRSKCYLVIFAPSPGQSDKNVQKSLPVLSEDERERLIVQLRHDVSSTKLFLQSLMEERDARTQELLSANEEIQSSNEELQSTNEELETTKEELQSSNEELHTVNDELQNRNQILVQASNDLVNLLNSVNLPVLMLTNDLNIRHFTPPTQHLMNLRPSDVGRPFSEIRLNLSIDDLTPLFHGVLETLTAQEAEVQDREGHWYLLRVRPYRTADNKIDGLVVAMLDIDQLRRSQGELRAARDFSTKILESVPLPLAVVDLEFRIHATNQAFCDISHSTCADLERRFLPDLASTLWGVHHLIRSHLERLRTAGQVGDTFEFEHNTGGEHPMVLSIRGCKVKPLEEEFLLITVEDITTHTETERALSAEKDKLAGKVASTAKTLVKTQNELRALTGSLFTSQEEERRRIARELHDDVSQRLAVLEIDSDEVEHSLSSDIEAARRTLVQMRTRIGQLADDVRVMSHRLHPSLIEDLGLKPALQNLIEDFGEREKMIATFWSEDLPENIPIDVATGLYRISQEALRNIAKHAGKTHVRVTLKGTTEGLQLQVADFGNGFEMKEKRSGLGLISMEERARLIGGTVFVRSEVGGGTKVTVDVPLPSAAAGA